MALGLVALMLLGIGIFGLVHLIGSQKSEPPTVTLSNLIGDIEAHPYNYVRDDANSITTIRLCGYIQGSPLTMVLYKRTAARSSTKNYDVYRLGTTAKGGQVIPLIDSSKQPQTPGLHCYIVGVVAVHPPAYKGPGSSASDVAQNIGPSKWQLVFEFQQSISFDCYKNNQCS